MFIRLQVALPMLSGTLRSALPIQCTEVIMPYFTTIFTAWRERDVGGDGRRDANLIWCLALIAGTDLHPIEYSGTLFP